MGIKNDPAALADALGQASELPLVAVGSGGALTLSELAVVYHQRLFDRPAVTSTPLMLKGTSRSLSHCAVLIVSARGANPDVLWALQTALAADAKRVIVLCGRQGSPLADLAAAHPHVDLIELKGSGRADGFLATGSLFSLGSLIARAFGTASRVSELLPRSLDDLLADFDGVGGLSEHIERQLESIWDRRYFIALHDSITKPAVADLESKLSETGLSPVQVVDYRNFAHGRHFWLARHAKQTGVISLESDACRQLSENTLRLFTERVPVLRIAFGGSALIAPLAAIAAPVLLTGLLGRRLGVDPGRPGVPLFGRRLYHLNASKSDVEPERLPAAVRTAIERKAKASYAVLKADGRAEYWRAAHRQFIDRLHSTRFQAVAFDYDGTLCERRTRFDALVKPVANALLDLLNRGMAVGIATGRGKSVRETLQAALPKKHWGRVLVGYYNCGQVASLNQNSCPVAGEPTGVLAKAAEVLSVDESLAELATLDPRASQVTLAPKNGASPQCVWHTVMHRLQSSGLGAVSVVRSSHSIDVLAAGVSKRLLLSILEQAHGPTLSIGDSGCWPGNDFELLAGPYGLSVDEVSPDPASCWNLGPTSKRGTASCLYYCSRLGRKSGKHGARLLLREHME